MGNSVLKSSRKYLIASLDQSLKRMGLDYVDIFYHHRPDPETPLEETMGRDAAIWFRDLICSSFSSVRSCSFKKRPSVRIRLSCGKPSQITDNLKALEGIPFTEDELKKIDECSNI